MTEENIERHVEEEGEMFPKARKALSEAEIEELGDRLQEAKQQQKQRPRDRGARSGQRSDGSQENGTKPDG